MSSTNDQDKITSSELKNLLTEKPSVVLIDLLPPDHFTRRHIPGARNACVFQISFLDDLARIAPDKQTSLVVYGASQRCHGAIVALEKLERAGYAKASYLTGGLEAWSAAGYDLEGEETDRKNDPQTTLMLLDGPYTVDAEASRLEWAGRNANTRHNGTVNIANGMVGLKDGTFSGSVEIDMNTIHNINLEGDELQPVLESHLRSDDFFFTKLFPKAVFTITKAESIKPASLTALNYHVDGELKLRGVTAELQFDATVSPLEDGSFALEAHFDIDRTRWNVIYGSSRFFEHLGMHKVFDLISFQIRMVINPEKGSL